MRQETKRLFRNSNCPPSTSKLQRQRLPKSRHCEHVHMEQRERERGDTRRTNDGGQRKKQSPSISVAGQGTPAGSREGSILIGRPCSAPAEGRGSRHLPRTVPRSEGDPCAGKAHTIDDVSGARSVAATRRSSLSATPASRVGRYPPPSSPVSLADAGIQCVYVRNKGSPGRLPGKYLALIMAEALWLV